jgi:ATP-dependent helicase/DNAse subunit B
MKLSYSQLSNYEGCPLSWYYAYVLKTPPKDQELKWANFGSAIHEALEAHYKGGDAIQKFNESWKKYKLEGKMDFDVGLECVKLGIER